MKPSTVSPSIPKTTASGFVHSLLLSLLIVIPWFLSGQVPEVLWSQKYGAKQNEIARTSLQTSDGNLLVAGYTESDCGDVVGQHGGKDAWVVKLDPHGNIVWARCIGTTGNEEVFSMQHTTAGNYILAGTKSVNGGDAWVFEMDENGDVLWEATYGGTGRDAAHSIALTSDGGYIVAGIQNESYIGEGWVFKLDGSGILLWSQTFTGQDHNSFDAIQPVLDGGYVAVGIRDAIVDENAPTYGLYVEGTFWALKLDGSGNPVWERTFGDTLKANYDRAHTILQTSDGNILIAGEIESNLQPDNSDPFVVKLDQHGNTLWQKSLHDEGIIGAVYSMIENPEGYLLAGGINYALSLVQLDNEGNHAWTAMYQYAMTVTSLTVTAPKDYMLAGYHWEEGGSNDPCGKEVHNFQVVKLNVFNIHYVDKNATGANNGTSWMDAFTDLQSALAAAQPNDHIWVAEGTYLPGQADSSAFYIDKDIKVYGGFAGTETALEQRDWAAYPTILSGDVNGDDVADDFNTNRTDNVNNILHLTADITHEMVLDGFIIEHAHADDPSPENAMGFRGGGMWSAGAPSLRNCTFRQNYAEELGAGAFFHELTGAFIVQDCSFESNMVKETPWGFGGAMTIFGSTVSQTIENCTFNNNFTGGLGIAGSSGSVNNCHFIKNVNPGTGAGLLVAMANEDEAVAVNNCQFTDNTSGQMGAGIYSQLLDTKNRLHVLDCNFEGNQANGLSIGGGMAVIANGENNEIDVWRCHFMGNIADEGGGLLVQSSFLGQSDSGAVHLNTTILECAFEENLAPNINPNIITGGAGICFLNIYSSEETRMQIDQCQFIGNASDNEGGGLMIYDETGDATYTLSNSRFSSNIATTGAGGLRFSNLGEQSSNLYIRSSILENNEGGSAGGIGIRNFKPAGSTVKDTIIIENSLVAGNQGTTGGISIQAVSDVFITESTIADNSSHGLKLTTAGNARLRNTILADNLSGNYSGSGSDIGIISLGGNLSDDGTLNSTFGPSDKGNTDPKFSGTGEHPHQLSEGSPAIDAAVPTPDGPLFDLAGNARIQGAGMDIGAYESPFTTPMADITSTRDRMVISPNPVTDQCQIKIHNDWFGTVELNIIDDSGRIVLHKKSDKSNHLLELREDISGLPAGSYMVTLSCGPVKQSCVILKL